MSNNREMNQLFISGWMKAAIMGYADKLKSIRQVYADTENPESILKQLAILEVEIRDELKLIRHMTHDHQAIFDQPIEYFHAHQTPELFKKTHEQLKHLLNERQLD